MALNLAPTPTPTWRAQLAYRLQRARHEPTLAIGVLMVVALTYLVIAPVVSMLADAVFVHFRDRMQIGQEAGELTSYYLWRTFRSPIAEILFWQPLLRTLAVSVGVTALSLGLGGVLAWLLVRTDLPGARWFGTALVVPYMLPSWTFALAWFTLFKNRRVAGATGFAESMGFSPPDWVAYGFFPIVVVLALHYFPFGLLLIGNALRRLDSQLEESAQILGASRWIIARQIVVPLMMPAVMSAVLLTFSRVIGTFGTPYVLGLPVDYLMLSTSLYRTFQTGGQGVTAVLAAAIVILGVAIVATDIWLVREYRRFVTVGGKGTMNRRVLLGRWRRPAAFAVAGIFVVTTIVPLTALLLSTLMSIPGIFTPSNFTAAFWLAQDIPATPGFPTGLLRSNEVFDAGWNSLRIAGSAAVVCGLLGLLVGYVVVRLPSPRLGAFLRQVSFLPYLVPGIAFAAAYLSLFAVQRGPVPALYGSLTLLVLLMTVNYLPYASRAGISAMIQLGQEPEEAAQICGAKWSQRLTRIVIPIQKGALATGIVLPFISGMKELSAIIMLATPGTHVLTTLSLTLIDFGYHQLANGLILLIVVIIFVTTYLAQRLTGSNLVSGLQGG